MDNKINVAVIGCGTIANNAHIPAYMANDKVNIKYFCDIREERAVAAAEKYGGKAVTDYKQILSDPEVSAVSVCTYNNSHAQISIDFLMAGKNVLCEKPAAKDLADVLRMQQAQKDSGKILNIGVVNRFNGAVNKIKSLMDEGVLGDVYHVYISFRAHRSIPGLGTEFTDKDVAGGGALIDWGVHFIDLVMYCCNDPKPVTVTGNAFCRLGKDMKSYVYKSMWAGPPNYDGKYDVDDSVTALIRTEGPVITLNGAWAQNIGHQEMFVDFIGEKAGIRLQYGGDFEIFGVRDGELFSEKPEYENGDHYSKEIDAFIDNIENGGKLPSNIDHVIPSAKILQAIYDSSDKNREVII